MQIRAGQVAFITGAGGGLGAGIARALAAEGAVLALADLQPELLNARQQEFDRAGVRCRTWVLDVSDREAWRDVAQEVESQLGAVSLLVNNAGVGYVGAPADQVPAVDYDWVMGVNVMVVINGVLAFVPTMRASGRPGHVVNVASIDGVLPEPHLHHAPYCASKAAVIGFSQALRNDLRPAGIGVTVVCPGLVQSALPESSRLRPTRFGGAYLRDGADAFKSEMARSGMPPERAGRFVVEAIRQNRSIAFTHPSDRDRVRAYFDEEYESAFEWSRTTADGLDGKESSAP